MILGTAFLHCPVVKKKKPPKAVQSSGVTRLSEVGGAYLHATSTHETASTQQESIRLWTLHKIL